MRLLLVLCLVSPWVWAAPQSKPTTRCGWFSNPTPGNVWLTDAKGEWVVGLQGGHQAEFESNAWPNFGSKQWVKTNGNYGYGCACLKVLAEDSSKTILRIVSSRVRPLRACESDPALAGKAP